MRPCALIPEIQFARAKFREYVFEHKLGLKMTTRSLSVFLVEDEALIRMMIADMVADLGHHVVAEADNISDASDYAMTANYDLAILDINLKGLYVDPVADLIGRRDKPFLFVTGYGPELLPSLFRRRPVLRKPLEMAALKTTIEAICP